MNNNPKIIALYLPQFYEIPENNEWWGEGFTEWTNVKRAKSLFKGHLQPNIPLNNNYYNTLDLETRKWQGELAKKYGVDGFCYYHYWFKGGSMLLEKPSELILQDGYPNIPFCFSWGNGNWARTWEGQPEEILKLQEYGDEEDWKNHFDYLLPFFQSPLYIRKNNKPIFSIHYTKHMGSIVLEPMIQKWQKWAIESGLPGIYFIETMTSTQNQPYAPSSSAIMEFEPLHAVRNAFNIRLIPNIIKHGINGIVQKIFKRGFFINKISYKNVWHIISHKEPRKNPAYKGKDIIFGGFVAWDNSPRKGKNSLIMPDSNPKTFEKYFDKHYQNAKTQGIEFIFLNAWNEWAEGAYLEPDEKNKYGYLEAIKRIKTKYDT